MTASLAIAFRLARRELRSGLQGFRIFLACLVLGVGAIAIVGALSAALERGIANEGRSLMGGDVEFSVLHNQPTPEQRAFIEAAGRVSRVATLRAMAAAPEGASALVEAKVADDAYPLYGTLELSPPIALTQALARDAKGRPGTVVEQSLLDRLGLKVGDALRVGTEEFTINASILREPDRISDGFVLGPRLMISDRDLEATGLARPGSLITWRYRVALPPPTSDAQVKTLVEQAGPVLQDEGWRVRSRENAAPGVRRFIDRLTAAFDPGHAARAGQFERAMRQRNRLLDDGVNAPPRFEGLEMIMAETGVAMAAARVEAVAALNAEMAARRAREPDSPFPWAGLELDGLLEAWLLLTLPNLRSRDVIHAVGDGGAQQLGAAAENADLFPDVAARFAGCPSPVPRSAWRFCRHRSQRSTISTSRSEARRSSSRSTPRI
jgi:hypothetical protein